MNTRSVAPPPPLPPTDRLAAIDRARAVIDIREMQANPPAEQ